MHFACVCEAHFSSQVKACFHKGRLAFTSRNGSIDDRVQLLHAGEAQGVELLNCEGQGFFTRQQMTACVGLLAMLARRAGGNSNNRKEHKTYNSAEPCQATEANPEGKYRCAECNSVQSRVRRLSQAYPNLVTGYAELQPDERAKFCKDCSSRFAQPQNYPSVTLTRI